VAGSTAAAASSRRQEDAVPGPCQAHAGESASRAVAGAEGQKGGQRGALAFSSRTGRLGSTAVPVSVTVLLMGVFHVL
jgi:hypothetical protein